MQTKQKYVIAILLVALSIWLCACGEEPIDLSTIEPSLPVLSIETVNKDPNVLDFVTKPVNDYVAKSIASWTPGYVMPPAPYYEECTVSLTNVDKVKLIDEATAKVKVRGNWTTNYEKKPLRINFDKPQDMLRLNELNKFKNWVLLAEYKDGSMLRDKLGLSMARDLMKKDGRYVSDAEFVEVYINGEYWGVYLVAEQQQVNENRVDITQVKKDYTGTDIGYFLEFDGYFHTEPQLNQFHIDYAGNAPLTPYDGKGGSGRTMTALSTGAKDYKQDVGFTIKSDIYDKKQTNFIASFVGNVYRVLYYAAYRDEAWCFDEEYKTIEKTENMTPREAVEAVIDLQSLVDIYIINELACDADVYWSSFYMSADFGTTGNRLLTFEAPWDFDSAFGNKSRCPDGTGFYAANIVPDVNGGPKYGGYETINPWLAVLANVPWYQELVKETWTKAYEDKVFDRALTMLQSDAERCKTAFANNYKRWNNIKNNQAFVDELSKKAKSCKNETEAIAYLYEWLESRIKFLNKEWNIR